MLLQFCFMTKYLNTRFLHRHNCCLVRVVCVCVCECISGLSGISCIMRFFEFESSNENYWDQMSNCWQYAKHLFSPFLCFFIISALNQHPVCVCEYGFRGRIDVCVPVCVCIQGLGELDIRLGQKWDVGPNSNWFCNLYNIDVKHVWEYQPRVHSVMGIYLFIYSSILIFFQTVSFIDKRCPSQLVALSHLCLHMHVFVYVQMHAHKHMLIHGLK